MLYLSPHTIHINLIYFTSHFLIGMHLPPSFLENGRQIISLSQSIFPFKSPKISPSYSLRSISYSNCLTEYSLKKKKKEVTAIWALIGRFPLPRNPIC